MIRYLICVLCLSVAAGATTITISACTSAAFTTAIGTAVTGDTVARTGPPCSSAWAARVVIPPSKGITIDGGGNTTLTSWGFAIQQGTSTTRVTGFISTNSSVASNQATWVADGVPGNAAYRIDHNTFNGTDSTFLTVAGNGPGLIDHNAFNMNNGPSEVIHNEGVGFGNDAGWTDSLTPGSSAMVFIEDNTFVSTWNFTVASAIQSYYGARTVVRHNDFTNFVVDQHGTPGNVGARWWEIYENRFFANQPPSICCAMNLRAGSGVIFNNTRVTGSAGIDLFEEDTGCSPSPSNPTGTYGPTCQVAKYQIGSGINGHTDGHATCSGGTINSSPVYIWGEGSWTAGSQTNNVRLGRDYFQSASQPATMSRMEVTGDTCATTYTYAPFTYPHPLQGSAALSITTSSLPGGTTNIMYSQTLTASGGTPPYNWSRTAGTFPTGISLNPGGGISGTPTVAGTYNVTIQVSDALSATASKPLSIVISTPPIYYVDNSGTPACSDTAGQDGSQANPFCTLIYPLNNRVLCGDTIQIKAGAGAYNYAGPGINSNLTACGAANPITIKNFPGHDVKFQQNGVSGGDINNGRLRFQDIDGLVFQGEAAHKIQITGFNQGLWLDGVAHATIQNINIHDNGQDCLAIHRGSSTQGSSFVTFQNSIINNCGLLTAQNGEGAYIGTAAAGSADSTHDVTIINNTISNTTSECVDIKQGTFNVIIDRNVCDHNSTLDNGFEDAAISVRVAVEGNQSRTSNPNHIVRNNTIISPGPGVSFIPFNSAIRLQTGVTASNNIIYGINSIGFCLYTDSPVTDNYPRLFYHNTCDVTSAKSVSSVSGPAPDVRNNIGPSTANNLIVSSAYFANYVAHDYHLVPGSAPNNAGANLISVVPTDFDVVTRTNPPDIGAYEFISATSVASLVPSSLTFASQNVGTPSVSQPVVLSNIGGVTMTISSIAFTGTVPGDYSQTNNCPTNLNVSSSCTINVTFTPTAIGSRAANLTVTSNASNSPTSAPVSGTGIVVFSTINNLSISGGVTVR